MGIKYHVITAELQAVGEMCNEVTGSSKEDQQSKLKDMAGKDAASMSKSEEKKAKPMSDEMKKKTEKMDKDKAKKMEQSAKSANNAQATLITYGVIQTINGSNTQGIPRVWWYL